MHDPEVRLKLSPLYKEISRLYGGWKTGGGPIPKLVVLGGRVCPEGVDKARSRGSCIAWPNYPEPTFQRFFLVFTLVRQDKSTFFLVFTFKQDKTRRVSLSGVFVKANHTGRGTIPLPFTARRQFTR